MLMALCASVCVTITSAQQSTSRGGERREYWSGIWDTNYGLMELAQDGETVIGFYEPNGGRIRGVAEGGTLSFIWSVLNDDGSTTSGPGEFEVGYDGDSFTGWWRFEGKGGQEPWEGVRMDERVVTGSLANVDYCLWRGSWNTEYGPVEFTQDLHSSEVEGQFTWLDTDGTLSGAADGWSLEFTWTSGDSAGDGEFVMSNDLGSFTGSIYGFGDEPLVVREGAFPSAEVTEAAEEADESDGKI